MGIDKIHFAHLVINDASEKDINEEEVEKWLKTHNIDVLLGLKISSLNIPKYFGFCQALFIGISNKKFELSPRLYKYVKYAEALGMPTYLIYQRVSDGKFQIYSFFIGKDNKIVFIKNETNNVLANYEHYCAQYQNNITTVKIFEECLKIEEEYPSKHDEKWKESVLLEIKKQINEESIKKQEKHEQIYSTILPVLPKNAFSLEDVETLGISKEFNKKIFILRRRRRK